MQHNSRNRLGLLTIGLALVGNFAAAARAVANNFIAPWEMDAFMKKVERGSRQSWKNGGQGRGAVARSKRAARKRKNIRARASKRRA